MLDEATANIDSYTEMLIQKALVKLLEGRTGLRDALARLATIREADRIIVLQNGELVESGSHQQLMANRKLYARLYDSTTGVIRRYSGNSSGRDDCKRIGDLT